MAHDPNAFTSGLGDSRNSGASKSWREHPLVQDRLFLTIPRSLIESIEKAIKPNPFGELRELEVAAIEAGKSDEHCVGFCDGQPVRFEFFSPSNPLQPPDSSTTGALGWTWNDAQLQLRFKVATARIDLFSRTARGYVGWLLTSELFQQEQRALLGTASDDGVDCITLRIIDLFDDPHLEGASAESQQAFNATVRAFLRRWRLRKLLAANLPVPALPLWGGQFPSSILPTLMNIGGLFHLPDTFPVPSRDELRLLLQEAVSPTEPDDHLEGWRKIIRGSNPAKNQIDRYSRIARLFHYWRVVLTRHRVVLVGKIEALQRAFGSFLHKSSGTIKSDLGLIRDRLGNDWAS